MATGAETRPWRPGSTCLKAGFAGAAEAFGPVSYEVEGRRAICPHCGGEKFAEGSAQLKQCNRIEWFGQAPERL